MPNYCENDLYIDGDAADVAAILALIGADRTPRAFAFSAVVPYPAEYAERDAEYQALGGFIEKNKPENAEKLAAFVAKWGDDRDGFNAGGYNWCVEEREVRWYSNEYRGHRGG